MHKPELNLLSIKAIYSSRTEVPSSPSNSSVTSSCYKNVERSHLRLEDLATTSQGNVAGTTFSLVSPYTHHLILCIAVTSCSNEARHSTVSSESQNLAILSPFDEQEEWHKISEILNSFGTNLGADVKESTTPNNCK